MYLHDLDLTRFQHHILLAGGQLEPTKGEWEVLRYVFKDRRRIIHKNKKGRFTLCDLASRDHKLFEAGEVKLHIPRLQFTLYTDASVYDKTRSGAWAACIVDNSGKLLAEKSGPLRDETNNTTHAELAAAANGIHLFVKIGALPVGSSVMVVCDNKDAVRKISLKTKSEEATKVIRDLAREHALNIHARWIKGHQAAERAAVDPDVRFNRLCDKLCRAHGRRLHLGKRDNERLDAN